MTTDAIHTGTLAVVFPGQGSQSQGMLSDIATHFPETKDLFAEASSVLGYDLFEVIENDPHQQLHQTEYTQPALLVSSYAIWSILQAHAPFIPAMMAGHSLGEYTALLCASAFSFHDAVKLVAARGRFMQEAVAPGFGAMAAIVGLNNDDVLKLCEEVQISPEQIVSPANFNSIGQVVISGHREPVEKVVSLAKGKGAKLAMMLPVSVPSHSPLMRGAAERLAALLNTIEIKTPSIPVVGNADVTVLQSVDAVKKGLVEQLYLPVRWVETIETFVKGKVTKAPITTIIECGPGKVLTGLNKRIEKSLTLYSTADDAGINHVIKLLKE